MATTTSTMKSKPQAIPLWGWIATIVLLLAGLAAWIYQLSAGMSVTSYTQQVVWGLYIAGFFTAAAAGAGLLFLVGLSEFRPVVDLEYRGRLLMMSIASFVAAAFLILMDIGNPLQAWRLIIAFRFNVPMTWDFWFLLISGVIALVYLLVVGKQSKLMGILAMLASLALVIVEGVLMASNAARPMWGGLAILGFLVGAVVAGLGLAMLILPKGEAHKLSNGMAWALGINLVMILVEVLAGAVNGNLRTAATVQEILAGSASPFFWFQVIAGLIIPLALLLSVSASWKMPAVAILALLGVLAGKTWLLVAEQVHPWVALPTGSYFPTWIEFLAVVGAFAVGALIFEVLVTFIKPKPA
jgi:dimethyl sulfoxide reductase membrane subunit